MFLSNRFLLCQREGCVCFFLNQCHRVSVVPQPIHTVYNCVPSSLMEQYMSNIVMPCHFSCCGDYVMVMLGWCVCDSWGSGCSDVLWGGFFNFWFHPLPPYPLVIYLPFITSLNLIFS